MQTIAGKVKRLRCIGLVETGKNVFNHVQQVGTYLATVAAIIKPFKTPMFELPITRIHRKLYRLSCQHAPRLVRESEKTECQHFGFRLGSAPGVHARIAAMTKQDRTQDLTRDDLPAQPLLGQNALVTGASKGIGKGIALALARAGADVVVNYNSDRPGAEAVVEEIVKLGRSARAIQADVGSAPDVDAMFIEAFEEFAPLTILVNNAGTQTWKALLDLTEQDWDRVINTNLRGCFLCTQRGARHMRDHGLGGSIINIGSGCNKLPFPNLAGYTASKGGIEMFTKVAAAELGQYKIRVNCAAPGAIEIERTKQEAGDYANTWARLTPLGRVGLPDDVAQVVVFLASSAARFVTAQTIWIDGGAFSKPAWPYD